MAKNISVPRGQYTVIWIVLLVGVGFYVTDLIVDVFIFRNGTLKEEILNPGYHETWMRSAVFLVAIAFAIYIQLLLRSEHKTSERAKTAEKFLNSVIDNIPNMIFIKDATELRFIRVNHAGEQLLGLTTQELMGKNDYDFFPESQAEFFTHKDREVLESGIDANIQEEQIDTASQGKRWLHTKKVPILDDKGQPIYLLGISEDITEVKQAASDRKKTEVRFQTLFDSAADSIFVIDPEGNIIETNRRACEYSGYGKHEIIGENIKKFFTEKSQDTCDCDFPSLRELGFNRADIEFVCKDGRIIQMECMATGVPDESGCFTSFLIIQRDVTDKNRAEKDARHHQRDMAHVMRLGTMGEMATGMAHELNQPLTALISYCGTAASLVNSLPSPPQQLGEILKLATEQAHRASDIIRHLRVFVSKEEKSEETFCLDQVIWDVITFLKWDVQESGIKIELRLGGQKRKVTAGKIQIEQVLINLVRNSLEAFEHAEIAEGRIAIQTRLLPNDMIEVNVTDNGPGIDATMADKVFDQFQTSKKNGMGIGLSLSRSIIEVHSGKLWMDKKHQNGALFSFELPVSE
jgi:PAS domain S-box-containing protein